MAEHKKPSVPGRPRLRSTVGGSVPTTTPTTTEGKATPDPRGSVSTGVSRTVQPPKQHIHCYECGYEYNQTGRLKSTNCPKCRKVIDLSDHTIDNEFRGELKTLGKVIVTERGHLNGANLVATDLELAGRVSNTKVEVYRELTIQPGASFRRNEITAPDLRIVPGAVVFFRNTALYRHVELGGALHAPLYVTGRIVLRAGGVMVGSLHTGHLVVEDGATLLADMDVGMEGMRHAEQTKSNLSGGSIGGDEQVTVPHAPLDEPEAATA